MIFWKLMLIIIGALTIVIGIIERVDLIALPAPDEQNLKLKVLYYCLIGVGIGMLVGGLMLL